MDYYMLAQRMVDLQGALHRLPISRKMPLMEGGIYFALNYLATHPGTHPRELSRKMGVSTARVAVLLRHLDERGLVCKQADANDNRQILVSITPLGLQEVQKKWGEVTKMIADVLEQLGPEDAMALLHLQERIVQIVERTGQQTHLRQ